MKAASSTKGVSERARRLRPFWLCMGLGLVALIVLVWLFGLRWWTALMAVLVIACPAAAAWLMLGGLDLDQKSTRNSR